MLETEGLERCNLKLCDPRSLLACTKVAAPINEIHGTEGLRVSTETFGVCRGSVAALADDVGVGIDKSMTCGRKAILPNTQSINRL